MKQAILPALARLSSTEDPVEMLLDVWVDAGFPGSFDAFCDAVARASVEEMSYV